MGTTAKIKHWATCLTQSTDAHTFTFGRCLGGPACQGPGSAGCCKTGYAGRLCALCADGYYSRNIPRQCVKCGDPASITALYITIGVFVVIVDVVLMFGHLDLANAFIEVICTVQTFRWAITVLNAHTYGNKDVSAFITELCIQGDWHDGFNGASRGRPSFLRQARPVHVRTHATHAQHMHI